MKRKKLKELLKSVKKSLSAAEIRYKETKLAAEEMNRTSRTSWSAAGDRVYADGQRQVNEQNLDSLLRLKEELEKVIGQSVPEKITTPCFVVLEDDEKTSELYLVKNVANIDGYVLLSDKSPVGKVLIGKKQNETIKLKPTEQLTKIVHLE